MCSAPSTGRHAGPQGCSLKNAVHTATEQTASAGSILVSNTGFGVAKSIIFSDPMYKSCSRKCSLCWSKPRSREEAGWGTQNQADGSRNDIKEIYQVKLLCCEAKKTNQKQPQSINCLKRHKPIVLPLKTWNCWFLTTYYLPESSIDCLPTPTINQATYPLSLPYGRVPGVLHSDVYVKLFFHWMLSVCWNRSLSWSWAWIFSLWRLLGSGGPCLSLQGWLQKMV